MRKYLCATVACVAIATPATAKDHSFYGGLDFGIMFPKDPHGSAFVDYTTTNATVPPGGTLPAGIPAGPADATIDNPFDFNVKTGLDADLLAGYDFGMFRLEGELGYKHTKARARTGSALLTPLNANLNRPSAAPDPGAPGLPALVDTDFQINNNMNVWSAMVNGLLDFGGNDGVGAFVGAGVGYAGLHFAGESKGKLAWQLIAGVYYPITGNIDIGIKGRYFQAGKVHTHDTLSFAGNPNRIAVGTPPVLVDQTTNAVIGSDASASFKSYSLLASLVYNFGAPPPPPPPAPPPPPPPPPAPPTQTCPDGSVIAATDTCPAPPPPPPPPAPAPAPERGH